MTKALQRQSLNHSSTSCDVNCCRPQSRLMATMSWGVIGTNQFEFPRTGSFRLHRYERFFVSKINWSDMADIFTFCSDLAEATTLCSVNFTCTLCIYSISQFSSKGQNLQFCLEDISRIKRKTVKDKTIKYSYRECLF